jgi:hypothetical protein
MAHQYWLYAHILLFVFWLGADTGVFLSMVFIRDSRLSFETRATIIKLAFYIDLFPRFAFALMIPVGTQLAAGLGVAPISPALQALTWLVGLGWCALHAVVVRFKGTPAVRKLQKVNVAFEGLAGLAFIGVGAFSLATGAPITAAWFAVKALLFGAIFWVVLGIDLKFQPFTLLLRLGPKGLTPEAEREVTRQTNVTLAWALLLYVLIAAIAFLGKVKPI